MYYKVLLVDDDENILQGYYRTLHKQFQLEVAPGGESALQAMENHGPFAVLIADMRMPGMDGLELLKIVKQRWPNTIRIMLTGNADQKTAMDAVNQGEVFRFLTKPCDSEQMKFTIQAALRQFFLTQAEKILLERTLMGSLRVLTDLYSLMDPEAYGLSRTIQGRVRIIGQAAGLEETWALEAAALLSPIGHAVLPRSLESKRKEGKPLSSTESALLNRVPEFGARLLESIPRMEGVATIIRRQDKRLDTSQEEGKPMLVQEDLLEAKILKIVTEFTQRERTRKDPRVVLENMKLAPALYDPAILTLLEKHLVNVNSRPAVERAYGVGELCEGMVLSRSAQNASGQSILQEGIQLGHAHIHLLKTLRELQDLEEPIYILEP